MVARKKELEGPRTSSGILLIPMADPTAHRIRGLFFVDVDTRLDSSHPYWPTISACSNLLSEVHVIVFTRGRVSKKEFATSPLPKIVVYHISRKGLFFHFFSIWKKIMFNLKWRKDVRPDFVVDMMTGRHAQWAALFARYIRRPFFSIVPTSRVYTKKYTPVFWRTKRFLHQAAQLFVSSEYIKMRISTRYHISQDRITVVTPPIDPELFVHTLSNSDITIDHKGYNFFISSFVETLTELRSFLAVYKLVETRYPRTGGVVFVDARLYKAATRLVHKKKMPGVFIHTRDDQFLPQLKASQVYLSVSKTNDINIPLLQALSLQVPVVTIGSGITVDIFKDSLYEQFLSYTDDPELLAHNIIVLMENHSIRLDYSINTKLLLDKAPMGKAIDYAAMLYLIVVKYIDPSFYEQVTKKQ